MNFSFPFDPSFVAWLAITLVHFVWQGTAVALVAGLAVLALRRAAAGARYGVLVVALAVMACCPPLTLFVAGPRGQSGARDEFESIPALLPIDESRQTVRDVDDVGAAIDPREVEFGQIRTDSVIAPTAAGAGLSDLPRAWNWRPFAPIAVAAYFAGVVLMLGRLAIGLYGGLRLCRRATPVDDRTILDEFARQVRLLGLRFTPAVLWCERVAVPVVVGVLRPTILLPVSLATGLAPDQVAAILTHELAHIRRYDHLIDLAQRLIEAFLFFHPAVWWLSRRIRIEREHCCDDLVVSLGATPIRYSESLLRVAELSQLQPGYEPVPGIVGLYATTHPSRLRQRITRLLGGPAEPRVRLNRSWTFGLVLAGCIAAAVPFILISGEATSPMPLADLTSKVHGVEIIVQSTSDAEAQSSESPQDGAEEPAQKPADEMITLRFPEGVQLRVHKDWWSGQFYMWGIARPGDKSNEISWPAGEPVSLGIRKRDASKTIDLTPLDSLPPDAVHSLYINGPELRPVDTKHIARLTGLKRIDRAYHALNDAALEPLATLQNLERLSIGSGVGDDGLRTIGQLRNLRDLYIGRSDISDAGLKHLEALPNLEQLIIDHGLSGISRDGYRSLGVIRSLKRLSLRWDARPTAEGMAALAELPQLELLEMPTDWDSLRGLSASRSISHLVLYPMQPPGAAEPTLQHFAELRSLEKLDLSGVVFTDDEFRHLGELTRLKSLNYLGTREAGLTDGALAHLAKLELETIQTVAETSPRRYLVTDAGLKHLAGMTSLRELQIGGPITDAGLKHLHGLKKLEQLLVVSNDATKTGEQDLLDALPNVNRSAGDQPRRFLHRDWNPHTVESSPTPNRDPAQTESIQTGVGDDWGEEQDGLRTRLVLLTEKPTVGEPLKLRLEIKNFGKVERHYDPQNVAPFRVVSVKKENGDAEPYIGPSYQTAGGPKPIKPGETVVLWNDYDVAEQFLLAEPGKYVVQSRGAKARPRPPLPGGGQREPAESPIPASNAITVELAPGKLPELKAIFVRMREIVPKEKPWRISMSGRVIYFTHSPTNLKKDVTTIQLWFDEKEHPPGYALGEGANKIPVERLGKTPVGFAYLTAPEKAKELWPEHAGKIRRQLEQKSGEGGGRTRSDEERVQAAEFDRVQREIKRAAQVEVQDAQANRETKPVQVLGFRRNDTAGHESAVYTSARGIGKPAKPGEEPRGQGRWQLVIPIELSQEDYARIIDFTRMKLAVETDGAWSLISNVSDAKPQVERRDEFDERWLHFSPHDGRPRPADLTLVRKADVSVSDEQEIRLVSTFEIEQLLARLERDHLNRTKNHTDLRVVRRTRFALAKKGSGFEFQIEGQEYFGEPATPKLPESQLDAKSVSNVRIRVWVDDGQLKKTELRSSNRGSSEQDPSNELTDDVAIGAFRLTVRDSRVELAGPGITARADDVEVDQGSKRIVLRADKKNAWATLWRWKRPGAAPDVASASTIFYQFDTDEMRIEGRADVNQPRQEADEQRKLWTARGQVTDVDGQPMPGVKIRAHCGSGSLRMTGEVESGDDGRYELRFGPGIWMSNENKTQLQAATISVHKAGFFEKNLHRQGDCLAAHTLEGVRFPVWGKKDKDTVFLPGEPKEINFVMLPAAKVSGMLVDKDGKLLAGYRMSLTGPELPSSSSVLASGGKTDENGRFEFRDIPTGYGFQILIEPPKAEPPWLAWASAALAFRDPGQRDFAAGLGKLVWAADRFEIKLAGPGQNWRSALQLAANSKIEFQASDSLRLETKGDEVHNHVAKLQMRLGLSEARDLPGKPDAGPPAIEPRQVPKSERSLRWERRGQEQFDLKSMRISETEQAFVITGGVTLLMEGIEGYRMVALDTDRMVLWCPGSDSTRPAPASTTHAGTDPIELYLEGNVVLQWGSDTARGQQIYYNVDTRQLIVASNPLPELASSNTTEAVFARAHRLRERARATVDEPKGGQPLQKPADGVAGQLRQLRATRKASGSIVGVDHLKNTVQIDRGSDDQLPIGTTFSVWNPFRADDIEAWKDGRLPNRVFEMNKDRVERASEKVLTRPERFIGPTAFLEIVAILGPHLSSGRITMSNQSEHIIPGNLVFSPTWLPGRPRRFALAGRFDLFGGMANQRDILVQLIARQGGVVDAVLKDDGSLEGEIKVDTDWLVLGTLPDDEAAPQSDDSAKVLAGVARLKKSAHEFGVEVIDQQKLYDLMGLNRQSKRYK